MKKLLLILALLTVIPAKSEVKDTTRMQLRIELTIGERLVQSLETGDFTVLSTKMESRLILIVRTAPDSLVKYVVPKMDMVEILNSAMRGIEGQASIYKKGDEDYLIQIEGPNLNRPILIAFGVADGMIYKVLLD